MHLEMQIGQELQLHQPSLGEYPHAQGA
jgi:hypothetical protein